MTRRPGSAAGRATPGGAKDLAAPCARGGWRFPAPAQTPVGNVSGASRFSTGTPPSGCSARVSSRYRKAS